MGKTLLISNLVKNFYSPDGSLSMSVKLPHLEMQEGESLVLTGPSGSGKTTVLHLIAGLLNPSAGSIALGSTCLTNLNSGQWDSFRAANLGYIFQNFNLINSLTVRENVFLPGYILGGRDGQDLKQQADRLLALVGLLKKKDSYPSSLSLGEKQRIAAVRAIFNKPSLILADEPTASLDKSNGEILLEILFQLAKENKSILLVSSHDEKVITRFPRNYEIGEGEKS